MGLVLPRVEDGRRKLLAAWAASPRRTPSDGSRGVRVVERDAAEALADGSDGAAEVWAYVHAR